jgi:hypothetical protein
MSEFNEKIRLAERIECSNAIKIEADSYMADGEHAQSEGRYDDSTQLFAIARALYRASAALLKRDPA